jgi:hypothetical protein
MYELKGVACSLEPFWSWAIRDRLEEVQILLCLSSFPTPGSTAEAARIIYPLEAQTVIVTKGQSLILECVASGIPPPRVTWAKDGSSIAAYNKTRFLLSNLLIDTTSEEDSGTYRCMASNGVGDPGAAVILYNVQVFGELPWASSSLIFPLI